MMGPIQATSRMRRIQRAVSLAMKDFADICAEWKTSDFEQAFTLQFGNGEIEITMRVLPDDQR